MYFIFREHVNLCRKG